MDRKERRERDRLKGKEECIKEGDAVIKDIALLRKEGATSSRAKKREEKAGKRESSVK